MFIKQPARDMSHENTESQEYEVAPERIAAATFVGPILEMAQIVPKIHDLMPEPFDITNHAGNLWGGTLIAAAASLTYALRNNTSEHADTISEESLSQFRKQGVALVMSATALANCITETQWGVKNLPVAELLSGTTPDVLDTAYSTIWAGVLAGLFWKKVK